MACLLPRHCRGFKILKSPCLLVCKLTEIGAGEMATEVTHSAFQLHKKCSTTESEVWQEKRIRITVEKLENFDPNNVRKVALQLEFMGNILAESLILLDENGCAETEVSAFIVVEKPDPRLLDDILAHPIIITLLETPSSVTKVEPEPKPSTKSKSAAKSSVPGKPKILGICNVDIFGLLTGQKTIRESLIVEKNQKGIGHTATSWPNLPRLFVMATSDVDEVILESADPFNNVVSITVESVYNAPINVPEGTVFDANFLIPCFGEKMENIVFTKGISTFLKDNDNGKQWSTMSTIEGRGNLTKFKIHYDFSDVFNPLPRLINLEDAFKGDSYKISWNKLRRCILTKTGFNIFFDKICKHRIWPIEITPTLSDKAFGNGKSGKPEKKLRTATSTTTVDSRNFIAFLDLSSLLYPGTTRVRVAAQLHTYSSDLLNKWALESSATHVHSQTSMPTVKSKMASRSKTGVSKEKFTEESKEEFGTPLFDESGKPVFIIVEIEIWKPYVPKRSPEFLHESLISYIPPKVKTPIKQMTCAIAEENFAQSIEAFSSIIQEAYYNFLTERNEDFLPENEEIYFYDYLCRTSDFQKIKLTLESETLKYVGEKFGNFQNIKDAIPELYVSLVEKIHKIIKNRTIEHSQSVPIDTDQFQLIAEEAIEEGNFKRAKRFLLQKIVKYKNNPDYWLDFAEFLLKAGEMEKAIESIREALSWDLGHQMGLVMYGLSMASVGDYCISETVFLTLLSKYPDFTEGWIIMSLFYLKIENYEGVQVALQTAARLKHRRKNEEIQNSSSAESLPENDSATFEKTCNALAEGKYGMASYVKGVSSTDPLAWTTSLCPENSLLIKTAILLLKIGFYEFAELALAQELLLQNCGRSVPYLYYTAVDLYYKECYNEAISQLEEAVKLAGKDCSVWSLMGHCYYKLKDCSNAIACYEYVIESYNRPDDIYLIYLRMCNYYLETKKFHCVKKLGLTACKYKSTPKILTLIGIACYNMTEFDEAETAFTEANFLDSFCPVIWGYLALVNIQLGRYDVFSQCYLEVKKKNLQDELLINEIEKLKQLKGFPNEP